MTDIAELGIRVDSNPATKAAKQLDALTASAARAEDATQDLAEASSRKLAPGMAAGGQQSRLMAMQLSQVAQQASATGNLVQALAIQLPDMAMGFGAVGIAAGVLASVTLPLLAGMFQSAAGSGKALKESMEDLAEAAESYRAALENLRTPSDELIAKYGSMSAAARDFAAAMAGIEAINSANAMSSAIQALTADLLALTSANEMGVIEWRFLADELGVAENQAAGLSLALGNLARAEGPEAQSRAAQQLVAQLDRATGGYANMNDRARQVYDSAVRIGVEAAKTTGATEATVVSAERLAQRMKDAYGMYAATRNMAAELAGETEQAAAAAFSLAQMQLEAGSKTYSGRGGDPRTSNQKGYGRFQYDGPALDMYNNPIAKGGGGGGKSDPYAENLQSLIESLRTEREIEEEWYQESLAILADRRAQEILGKQAHDEAMIALHEEYQRRIAEIDAQSMQSRLADTANLFGALASIAEAGGRKQAKAAATFAAIATTVNGYATAMDAARMAPTLPGKIAAYAAWIGQTAKAVSAIRSAGGIGGGGGRVAAQGITSQASGPPIEYRVYGLERDAVYSGEFIEKIFSGLMEEGKRRGMTNQSVVFVG